MNKRIDFGFVLTQKTWALVGSPQSTQSAIGTWSVTSSSLSFKKHSLNSFILPISSIPSISFSQEKKKTKQWQRSLWLGAVRVASCCSSSFAPPSWVCPWLMLKTLTDFLIGMSRMVPFTHLGFTNMHD